MILHPVVQLKFGGNLRSTANQRAISREQKDVFLTTIPPDHLQEFTYTSQFGADSCTMVFIDHTFGTLEYQIFRTDREEGGNLLLRWGYPDNGLEEQDWKLLKLVDYQPTLDYSGLRISITAMSFGSDQAARCEPKVYRGKISSVVAQIAKDSGYTDQAKIFIEETDDDRREESDRQAEWPTGNKTRAELLQKLIEEAKSKKNPNGTYEYRFGGEGTFEFCTEYFRKQAQAVHGSAEPEKQDPLDRNPRRKGLHYRRVEVLFGRPNNATISFRPRYGSKVMGHFARSSISGVYDPRTKQFQQTLVDRRTLGMTSSKDPPSGGRTTAAPYVGKDASKIEQRRVADTFSYQTAKQVALGGHCSGKQIHDHRGPDIARNKIESAWKRLHNLVMTGSVLELLGVPEYANLSVLERFLDIVVIPPATDHIRVDATPQGYGQGLHWSSGRYRMSKVIHEITADYKITVELHKPTMLDGPDSAKTGRPVETPPTITRTS